MRKTLVSAGAVLLVVGLVVFVVCVVQVAQASAAFMNCLNGNPIGYPYGSVPTACTDAMGTMILYGTLEWVGFLLGIGGFVLLLVGLLLQPPRPEFAPPSYYPPPAYIPPPAAAPPQGPQTPPQR